MGVAGEDPLLESVSGSTIVARRTARKSMARAK